jgi:F-type H+-transporting ATPase subunit delta
MAPVLARLLVLLADRDRLGLIPDVLAAYRERLLEHFKVVRAEVTTAVALPEGQAKALEQRLAKVTGRTVTLATQVDPSIIGGVILEAHGQRIDASIASQLESARRVLSTVTTGGER